VFCIIINCGDPVKTFAMTSGIWSTHDNSCHVLPDNVDEPSDDGYTTTSNGGGGGGGGHDGMEHRRRRQQATQAETHPTTPAVDTIPEDMLLGGMLPSGMDLSFRIYMGEITRRTQSRKRKQPDTESPAYTRKRMKMLGGAPRGGGDTSINDNEVCPCCARNGTNKQMLDKTIIQAVGTDNFYDAIHNATETYNMTMDAVNRTDLCVTRAAVTYHVFTCMKDPRVVFALQNDIYKYMILQQMAALEIGKTAAGAAILDTTLMREMRANTKMLCDIHKVQAEKSMFFQKNVPSAGDGNVSSENRHSLLKVTTVRPCLY
jgi:hypothetical protein